MKLEVSFKLVTNMKLVLDRNQMTYQNSSLETIKQLICHFLLKKNQTILKVFKRLCLIYGTKL